LPGNALGEEIERFRDHWAAAPAAKGCKLDWSATWRNWVREAVRRNRGGSSTASFARPGRMTQESALAAIDAAARLTSEPQDGAYVMGNDEPIKYED
jgi:hypothetical protein